MIEKKYNSDYRGLGRHCDVEVKLLYRGGSAVIVTLGSFLMRSVPRDKVAAAAALGSSATHEETVELMRTSSYDHFTIELVNIQVRPP